MTNTFSLRVTKEQIDVLRARLRATHWPSYDSRDDWSLGTSSDGAKRLAQYWGTQFDFDSLQQRLAALALLLPTCGRA
jgi:Epoxide hydrolase N terminus